MSSESGAFRGIKMIVFDYDGTLTAPCRSTQKIYDEWHATVDAFVAKYAGKVSYGICTAGVIFKDEILVSGYPRFPPGMLEMVHDFDWWNLMFMSMIAESKHGFDISKNDPHERIPLLKVIALKETAEFKKLQHHEILFIDDSRLNIEAAKKAGFMTQRIKGHEDFKKAEEMLDL